MDPAELPDSIDDLEVEGLLGEGATGVVLRARSPDGKPVAIKLLRAGLTGSARARFLRELELGRSLTHPGLVRLYGGGEFRGRPYLVFELIEGRTLADVLRERPGPRDTPDVLAIMDPICRAVSYLHDQGVVHRDIKPSNVLVEPSGKGRLADLGLARPDDGEALTATGAVVGTLLFMAPEQLRGEEDRGADIFALGILAYMLLTGRHPFRRPEDGEDMGVFLRRLQNEPPLPVHPSGSCSSLDVFFHRALAGEPAHRHPSAQDLLGALRRILLPEGRGRAPEELARRFSLGDALGRGAMGWVAAGTLPETGRPCAVKLCLAPGDRLTRERMLREARLMGAVRHPHLVDIYEQGETEGVLWIAMELLDGRTLADLALSGELSEPEAMAAVLDLAGALEALHEAGVVHRDVKPANVMRTRDGRVVLMDLGLGSREEVTTLTSTGKLVGTPLFLSPESLTDGVQDPAGDFWALGVTLFLLVEGRTPATFPEIVQVAQNPSRELHPPVFERAGPVTRRLVQALMRPLPGERPRSRAALEALAEGRAPEPPSRSSSASTLAVLREADGNLLGRAAGSLALVALLLFMVLRPGESPTPATVPQAGSGRVPAFHCGSDTAPEEVAAALQVRDRALAAEDTRESRVARAELWAEAGDCPRLRARPACRQLARSLAVRELAEEEDPDLVARLRFVLERSRASPVPGQPGAWLPSFPRPVPGMWGASRGEGSPLVADATLSSRDFEDPPLSDLDEAAGRARQLGTELEPPPGWVERRLLPELRTGSGPRRDLALDHPELVLAALPFLDRDSPDAGLELLRKVHERAGTRVPGYHLRREAWRRPWSRFLEELIDREFKGGGKPAGLRLAREVVVAVGAAPGPWSLEELWMLQQIWRELHHQFDNLGECPELLEELLRIRFHHLEAALGLDRRGEPLDRYGPELVDWYFLYRTRPGTRPPIPDPAVIQEALAGGGPRLQRDLAELDMSLPLGSVRQEEQRQARACNPGLPPTGEVLPDALFPRAPLSMGHRFRELLDRFQGTR